MTQYIISFIVYTLAMAGALLLGFVVYKKAIMGPDGSKHSSIKIVDMARLPDRKMLYVIKCANEKFLIASSTDKVNLISKLETKEENKPHETNENEQEILNKKKMIKSLLKELSDKNRGNF